MSVQCNMQVHKGVVLQLMHSQGRTHVLVDGHVKLHFDDGRCLKPITQLKHCTGVALHAVLQPGQLAVGGRNAATVILDHFRIYNYAVPFDDVAAEAVCSNYGNCQAFGVAEWQAQLPIKPIPENAFAPPSIQFVAGMMCLLTSLAAHVSWVPGLYNGRTQHL